MRSLESILIRLDETPFEAVWRMAFGFVVLPVLEFLSGDRDRVAFYFIAFLLILAALRVGPAVLRKVVPFSAEATALWKAKRFTAKEFDSYQWQKLFWIGIGMLVHAISRGDLGMGERVIAAFCLFGGGAGQLTWRAMMPPQSATAAVKEIVS